MIKLYPGPPMWWKRLLYAMIIGSMGANVFIGQIQSGLLKKISSLTTNIELMMPSVSKAGKIVRKTMPLLESVEAIAGGQSDERWGGGDGKIERALSVVEEINLINRELVVRLDAVLLFIRIASLSIWISTVFAVLWMANDLRFGRCQINCL